MPRGVEREPGLKKLTLPERTNDMQPNMGDHRPERGPLAHVLNDGLERVMCFGGEPTPTGGYTSPARATFAAGHPTMERSQKETRVMPETQLPGSYNTNAGQGAPIVSRNLRARPSTGAHED